MKNIKNIKYIILVVLVLVLIYILLKYKEKFITLADFNTEYTKFKEQKVGLTELKEFYEGIQTNINAPAELDKILTDGGTSISDKIQNKYVSIISKLDSDYSYGSAAPVLDTIEPTIFLDDSAYTNLKTEFAKLHTSIKNIIDGVKTQEDAGGALESVEIVEGGTNTYKTGDSFVVTSTGGTGGTGGTEGKISLTESQGSWTAEVVEESEGQGYKIGETLTKVVESGQVTPDTGLKFTVRDIKLDLSGITFTDIESFNTALTALENMELNIEKLVGDAVTDAATDAAAAAAETAAETAGHITVDSTYKVESLPTDLNKIDRHLLWSNYTIEHDLEAPNETGKDQYDMAYDNISEKGEVKYLKAGRSETASTSATFLDSSNRHSTLADNSIILIGSIVLTFISAPVPNTAATKGPLKINSNDQLNDNYVNYEIKDIKDEPTRKIIIFKKNKYINVEDFIEKTTISNLETFNIEFNFSGLYTTNITAAHMNYILINPTGSNKPSEIIYDLINANYNILNYKTKILVNYLKCRHAVVDKKWEPNTDGKVCDLMDDGFIPTDLDSRLYGALKVTLLDGQGDPAAAKMDASITKNKQIIDAIIAYLGKDGNDNKKLEEDDMTVIKAALGEPSGLPDDVDAEQIKAALGYTG
jgi:hypothetical protein